MQLRDFDRFKVPSVLYIVGHSSRVTSVSNRDVKMFVNKFVITTMIRPMVGPLRMP